ncbi:MAG TPA: 3-methyl-2-oxobutanoate hydroxymethyltransferase, partial [candidate division Zixibacteria bacterium]|nr:3-methyl-2-oxobutanoate hydroxymethyltransferase [candidate division Zixibacteria bacterium]
IGAGVNCDGQVLVINDILGLYEDFKPKFVRQYANLPPIIEKAARDFIADVKSGAYPSDNESFY